MEKRFQEKSEISFRDMDIWDLPAVIKLADQIVQPGRQAHSIQMEDYLKRFLTLAGQKKAICQIYETTSFQIAAFFILILEENEILNFTLPPDPSSSFAYLAQIAVDKEFQSQGLGKRTMNEIEKICKTNKKEFLLLEVNSRSKALEFYKNLKFEEFQSQVFLHKKL